MNDTDKKTLYVCGTVIGFECVPENSGMLEFYTTKEALQDDKECWRECGIWEVSIEPVEQIVKPNSNPRGISGEEIRRRENVYVPLGNKLAKIAKEEGGEEAESALTWALGGLKREARRRRAKQRKKIKAKP